MVAAAPEAVVRLRLLILILTAARADIPLPILGEVLPRRLPKLVPAAQLPVPVTKRPAILVTA